MNDKEKIKEVLGILEIKIKDYEDEHKEFFDEFEMNGYELNKRCKKEITEHFDKLFKDPEFERMITKANDEAPEGYGD